RGRSCGCSVDRDPRKATMYRSALAGLMSAMVVLATMASGASAAGRLGSFKRPSTLSAYGGVLVWSAYDTGTRRYSLMMRVGADISVVPVPPRARPFDAVVSRGSDGRPTIVFGECSSSSGTRRCGLVQY